MKSYKVPEGDFNLYMAAERGVEYGTYTAMMEDIGLPSKELATVLQVSERTLQRMREDQRKMDTNTSERILELVRLFVFGEAVFGTQDNFNQWIHRHVFSLGNRKPIDLMTTLAGIRVVRTELGRIEYGMPV